MSLERHYKPEYVARQLDVDVTTVYKWCRTGVLRSILIGGSRRIPESELQRHLNAEPQDDTNADVIELRGTG